MAPIDVLGQGGWYLLLAGFVLAVAGLASGRHGWMVAGEGIAAVGCWLMTVASALTPDPAWTAIHGACAAYWTWRWWRDRPKGRRRKALRELGAKSRARVAALVRQMTPSPIPSPAGAPR